jgi:regulator of nucleoside diphosphate kinase
MEVLALERTLTEVDHMRLTDLVRSHARSEFDIDPLENMLDAARIVPSREISPDTVTMYSQVMLAFPAGRRKKLTICYPADAQPSVGFVSVLSPVGSSVIGLRVGEMARWRTPLGDTGWAEVLDIPFQPEASGDYTT